MESQAPRVIYCVDTSSFVTIQRTYPLAVFLGLWERLSQLATEGRLAAPREAFNELKRGGDDEIFRWADDHRFIFRDPDAEQIEVAKEIVNDAQFQRLFDIDSERPEADPFVIALAVVARRENPMFPEHWVVVADEGRVTPGRKPRIPDVCRDRRYQLECIRTLDMFVRENWQFK